jgi:hypothetical protein
MVVSFKFCEYSEMRFCYIFTTTLFAIFVAPFPNYGFSTSFNNRILEEGNVNCFTTDKPSLCGIKIERVGNKQRLDRIVINPNSGKEVFELYFEKDYNMMMKIGNLKSRTKSDWAKSPRGYICVTGVAKICVDTVGSKNSDKKYQTFPLD